MISNAFFTEPEDSSGWMYHRWLLGRAAPLECSLTWPSDGETLFNSPPIVAVEFTEEVRGVEGGVSLLVKRKRRETTSEEEGDEDETMKWRLDLHPAVVTENASSFADSRPSAKSWIAETAHPLSNEEEERAEESGSIDRELAVAEPLSILLSPRSPEEIVEVTLRIGGQNSSIEAERTKKKLQTEQKATFFMLSSSGLPLAAPTAISSLSPPHLSASRAALTEAFVGVLDRETSMVEELLEEEPQSKWARLALLFLLESRPRPRFSMSSAERREDEEWVRWRSRIERAKAIVGELVQIDPKRNGHYRDLESTIVLKAASEEALLLKAQSISREEQKRRQREGDEETVEQQQEQQQLLLTDYPSSPRLFLQSLNLTRLSGSCLAPLVFVQHLHLDDNSIRDTRPLCLLPSLRSISLRRNFVQRLRGVEGLKRLSHVDLRDNRIEKAEGLTELFSPFLKELESVLLEGNPVCGDEPQRRELAESFAQLKVVQL